MLVHILEGFEMEGFPVVRSSANLDRRAWSDAHGLECKDVSRAIQSQKEEADINTIVRNFGLTGKVPVGLVVPTFEDYSEVTDFRTALEVVREAEAAFLRVPSALRDELRNDPQLFLEWCADKANLPRMRELGMALPELSPANAESPPG